MISLSAQLSVVLLALTHDASALLTRFNGRQVSGLDTLLTLKVDSYHICDNIIEYGLFDANYYLQQQDLTCVFSKATKEQLKTTQPGPGYVVSKFDESACPTKSCTEPDCCYNDGCCNKNQCTTSSQLGGISAYQCTYDEFLLDIEFSSSKSGEITSKTSESAHDCQSCKSGGVGSLTEESTLFSYNEKTKVCSCLKNADKAIQVKGSVSGIAH